MQRFFKLLHHKHTGKLLAHHHTSYPALLLFLLLSIVMLSRIDQSVVADDIVVTAKVSAAIPSSPAIMTIPVSGDVFTESNLTITGTCQIIAPSSIIAIYNDANLLGSTICDTSGMFTIDVVLGKGANNLIAKSINVTNDFGPDSPVVSVTYSPPVPIEPEEPVIPIVEPGIDPEVTPVAPETEAESDTGLRIVSKHTYLLYGPSKDAVWEGYFEGGTAPYSVMIDWGDGVLEHKTDITTDEIQFRHKYNGSATYYIALTITDTDGRQATQQLVAVTPYVTAASTDDSSSSSGTGTTAESFIPGVTPTEVVKAGVYTVTALLVTTTATWFGIGVHTTASTGAAAMHLASTVRPVPGTRSLISRLIGRR